MKKNVIINNYFNYIKKSKFQRKHLCKHDISNIEKIKRKMFICTLQCFDSQKDNWRLINSKVNKLLIRPFNGPL